MDPTYFFPRNQNTQNNDKIINLSDSGTVRVTNDIAKYSYTIESNLFKTSNNSYASILNPVSIIRSKLNDQPLVENVKINFSNNPIYDYHPTRKFLGYKTEANITYDFKLKEKNSLKQAAALQNNIMSVPISPTSQGNILINSTSYQISDKAKRLAEMTAIKRAITNAKNQAHLIVNTAYNSNINNTNTRSLHFEIIELNVNSNYVEPYPFQNAQNAMMTRAQSGGSESQTNVLSQGSSKVVANVTMKIKVINY